MDRQVLVKVAAHDLQAGDALFSHEYQHLRQYTEFYGFVESDPVVEGDMVRVTVESGDRAISFIMELHRGADWYVLRPFTR